MEFFELLECADDEENNEIGQSGNCDEDGRLLENIGALFRARSLTQNKLEPCPALRVNSRLGYAFKPINYNALYINYVLFMFPSRRPFRVSLRHLTDPRGIHSSPELVHRLLEVVDKLLRLNSQSVPASASRYSHTFILSSAHSTVSVAFNAISISGSSTSESTTNSLLESISFNGRTGSTSILPS
jgi:hypothetical protein